MIQDLTTERIKNLFKSEMVKSKREGRWFGLSKQDRSFYALALKLKVRFQSVSLIRALTAVLKKLKKAGDALYNQLMTGAKLARDFSEAAVSWGNKAARGWRYERAYIIYLGRLWLGNHA